ncbi:hypothetical protein [Hydrogenophaga electricum]|uniref:Uncharacterized protein n=1 Tax=Hydrogenophaga electricum TaxID=1230953 RepID=A0ABQ6C3R3_9BURK|nr:hypothetical protein [Hydrogenophaga electricum]GLS13634.1 hypothetical protein GCM10007935_10640 [Hydrogenophaga electricum]
MKTTITFEIDTQGLDGYTDEYIAQLWHIAQANPEPWCNKEACELVGKVGTEIIRRWLTAMPPPLHHHAPGSHDRATLQEHGKWIGGVWTPNIYLKGESA